MNGRVEKSIEKAHEGAVVVLKWSRDGQTLLSSGEDRIVKIWSKAGILRSELQQQDSIIYSISWSPNDQQFAIGGYKTINIKELKLGQRDVQFKAHDGVVLALDWNSSNNLILSCGEDYLYKIYDSYGRNLFTSARQE